MPTTRSKSSVSAPAQASAFSDAAAVGASVVPAAKKTTSGRRRKNQNFLPNIAETPAEASSSVAAKGMDVGNDPLRVATSKVNKTSAIFAATFGDSHNSLPGLPKNIETETTKNIAMPAGATKQSAEASSSAFAKETEVATRNEGETIFESHNTAINSHPVAEIGRYQFRARATKPKANLTEATSKATKTSKVGGKAVSAKDTNPMEKTKRVLDGRVAKRNSKTATTSYDKKKWNQASIQAATASNPNQGNGTAEVQTKDRGIAPKTNDQEKKVKKLRVINWIFIRVNGMLLISEKVPPIILGGGETSDD